MQKDLGNSILNLLKGLGTSAAKVFVHIAMLGSKFLLPCAHLFLFLWFCKRLILYSLHFL